MLFRILGSLEVHSGAATVPLRGRQQPKILALLLLEANHGVGMSRIVDTLWETDPPATARQQVQNVVSALKRELARAGLGEVLISVGDGYRLNVEPATFDVLQFDAYVADARDHRAAGRNAEALRSLRDGLALWRGPALTGLSGRHIEAGARRLEESRFSVIEERVDLELGLGEHRRLVGELRELLADHPFRQRLVGQLMLALYRGGRTTEALDAYTECRTGLAEELGIDPGTELRRLHERILRADPDLDPVAKKPVNDDTGPVPAQLPADTGSFAGRVGELAILDDLLSTGDRTAVLSSITGAGGVGKTALAVHWAHLRRKEFPDGQLFANLRGYDTGEPVPAIDVLARFLRALGANGRIPSEVDEAAALYRSLLAERRVLIVLDNARSVDQARPLLPGSAGCLALVTSRDDLRGLIVFDDARPVRLDALRADESVALLSTLLGAERVDQEPSAARRLARLCGYLPLALRIVAANLAGQPYLDLTEFANRLDDHNRLDLLRVDGDPRATVAAAFDLSYATLDPPVQAMFRSLGLIPGPDFSAELAAAIMDLPAEETNRLLARLTAAHLLEQHVARRFRFHDLLRLYAAQRALADDDKATIDAGIDRMIRWYGEIPESADDEEHAGRVAALQKLPPRPGTWRMALRMSKYANEGHRIAEIRQCVEIALASATEAGELPGLATMHSHFAVVCAIQARFEEGIAHGERAVELARTTGDRRLEGVVLCNLGILHRGRHDLHTAERLMYPALAIARELGDLKYVRSRLINTGLIHIGLARYPEAEECLTEALAIVHEDPDRNGESHIRQAIAKLYVHSGRYAEAFHEADAAVHTARESKLSRAEVFALSRRAEARHGLGQLASALADSHEAIELAYRLGLRQVAADIRVELALIRCDIGEPVEARDVLRNVLEECTPDTPLTHSIALLHLSHVHLAFGEAATAIDYAARAREEFVAMEDRRNIARSLRLTGDGCARLGLADEAAEHWRAALAHSEAIGHPMAVELRERLATHGRNRVG